MVLDVDTFVGFVLTRRDAVINKMAKVRAEEAVMNVNRTLACGGALANGKVLVLCRPDAIEYIEICFTNIAMRPAVEIPQKHLV